MIRSTKFQIESSFNYPLDDVWSVLADTNRLNETMGKWLPYTVEDIVASDGSVKHHAKGRLGPRNVEWEEGFGEWIENRDMRQKRIFKNGPINSLGLEAQLIGKDGKVTVLYDFDITWDTILGGLFNLLGGYKKICKTLVRAVDDGVSSIDQTKVVTAPENKNNLTETTLKRLEECIRENEQGLYGHGLGDRLAQFLKTAHAVDLKKIRALIILIFIDPI